MRLYRIQSGGVLISDGEMSGFRIPRVEVIRL